MLISTYIVMIMKQKEWSLRGEKINGYPLLNWIWKREKEKKKRKPLHMGVSTCILSNYPGDILKFSIG